MSSASVETHFVALPDPPETSEGNAIHSEEGARAAGFPGALVAGIHTYGWATTAIVELLGETWLYDGWVDVKLRKPVYAGDNLVTVATTSLLLASGLPTGELRMTKTDKPEETVLEGTFGLGRATFFAELAEPGSRTPEPQGTGRQRMLLETAPVGEDFRPMAVDAGVEAARDWAHRRLGDDHSRYHKGPNPLLHPSFLAGRMTPLFRHSYLYGPAIHLRTQMQHLAPARSGQALAVGARLHSVFDRNGHHAHESDCWIYAADGSPIAAKRHTGIFRVAPKP